MTRSKKPSQENIVLVRLMQHLIKLAKITLQSKNDYEEFVRDIDSLILRLFPDYFELGESAPCQIDF